MPLAVDAVWILARLLATTVDEAGPVVATMCHLFVPIMLVSLGTIFALYAFYVVNNASVSLRLCLFALPVVVVVTLRLAKLCLLCRAPLVICFWMFLCELRAQRACVKSLDGWHILSSALQALLGTKTLA